LNSKRRSCLRRRSEAVAPGFEQPADSSPSSPSPRLGKRTTRKTTLRPRKPRANPPQSPIPPLRISTLCSSFPKWTPTHRRFRGLVRHSNRQQSAPIVQKTQGTIESDVGSAEMAGPRTPTRLLGSYRRVFISHRSPRGVPVGSHCLSMPVPTAVTIPTRVPTQPIRRRPNRLSLF